VTKTSPFATCWRILPQVSRSFAVVIRWLPKGLDDAVMVSYLLCRIADTLEDSVRDVAEKRRQLARFGDSLDEGSPEIPLDAFPATYLGLMTNTDAVLASYRALPASARTIIRARVQEMCGGMSKWCDKEIVTVQDQNEYCYYVAGLVGLMLTDLFHAYGHVSDRDKAQLTPLAVDFGLALQKVNILKDQSEDEASGRFLVPDRHELLASLRRDGEGALAYLQALPSEERGYRIFCAWSLMMGAVTISLLDHVHVKQSRRDDTAQLLARTAAIAEDNAALGALFAELMPRLPEHVPGAPLAKPESVETFRAMLAAPLTDAELRRLGIGAARA